MSLGLNPGDTPELFKDKDGNDLPIESLNGTDKTAYLKIDLQVHPMGGQPVVPMTAVFAPDPTKLSGAVNILLWLHGDKSYWNVTGKESFSFHGKSIQYYLNNLKLCKLREFILGSSGRNFILVAPTLNDRTGININGKVDTEPGGLRWDQGDAEAYLQQCVNGVKQHFKANATSVGNIVLAAHSGGGHIQSQMAGKFDKMNEVWCFDSSYWGSAGLIKWARKGHSHPRLWVYSTGGTTGYAAADIKKLTDPPAPPKPAKKGAAPPPQPLTTKIEVLIHGAGKHGMPVTTDYFVPTYGGSAVGHYEGMQKYLPTLVGSSQNLN